MIKGILFDKDGTLLEFHSTQHYIYANVFAYLQDRYRVPGPLLQELREALGHLPDRLTSDSLLRISTNPQIAQALFDPSKKYAAEHPWQLPFDKDDLLELIEELSVRDDVPYTALPDVPETLRYLKHKGYKLGIATTDTLTATVAGLKKTGIFDYFDYLGTGEEFKTEAGYISGGHILQPMRSQGEQILIVGDSQNDMRFAENAGAAFIGLDAPGDTTSVFKENGHRSVSNIIEIIDELIASPVIVRIVDLCPECDASHLDLSREAFARIADLPQGRVDITWRVASPTCPGRSPITPKTAATSIYQLTEETGLAGQLVPARF